MKEIMFKVFIFIRTLLIVKLCRAHKLVNLDIKFYSQRRSRPRQSAGNARAALFVVSRVFVLLLLLPAVSLSLSGLPLWARRVFSHDLASTAESGRWVRRVDDLGGFSAVVCFVPCLGCRALCCCLFLRWLLPRPGGTSSRCSTSCRSRCCATSSTTSTSSTSTRRSTTRRVRGGDWVAASAAVVPCAREGGVGVSLVPSSVSRAPPHRRIGKWVWHRAIEPRRADAC